MSASATTGSRSRVRVGLVLVAVLAGVLWCVPVAAADTNLVGNPGFETGTSGWGTSGSSPGVTLTQVAGGHSGGYAALVTNTSNAKASTCELNDSPNWVTTAVGGRYTASLWVRADVPGAMLQLQLREYSKDYPYVGAVGQASQWITLTTSWQEVTVTYATTATPIDPGLTKGSTLDFSAYVDNAPPGTCFYADDAAIALQPAPVAALTVTPTQGVVPLTVHADASASRVTDLPIASYMFDFSDGTIVGPQPEPTADHTYLGGAWGVSVTVTDTDGRSSRVWSDGDGGVRIYPGIVGNPTFDQDTSGWNTSGSGPGVTLTQVPGGHSSARLRPMAAQLANGGTAAASCVLNDAPNWVKTTAAGRYTGSLWVRSDRPGATLKLKLREYRKDTGALVGAVSATAVLTTSWQQVQVAYTPVAVGASTLDYTASVGNVAAGSVCFDADDATIAFDPVPAAALTVTPAGGTAPVSVHADASASTATPGTSYIFDFGDGSPVVGPQYTATADHSYAAAGTYTVTVRLYYQDGETAVATQQVTVSAGIVGNPSFESGTSGWNASGSGPGVTLTQIPGGHSGSYAARLSNGGTAAASCVLNDAPNWLPTTASGGAYIASLWVRSDSPGSKLTLKLREYHKDTGALVGSASNAVTLSTSWQQIAVTYTPLAPSASTLDYTASVGNAAPGSVCFDADDSAVAPTPAPALTVTPGTVDAPLAVYADASASTGSNGTPIASYTFDFEYGPVVGPQAAPTADYTYGSGGTYTVTVTVTDTAGRTSTTTRQVTTAERVGYRLEWGTDGWGTEGSSPGVTLTRVAHSNDGLWAADLENGATPAATCVLNDAPNWITTTANGQYTASLWARAADLTGPNVPLTLTLREYSKDTGALLGSASSTITLKTNWKQASLTYTPLAPGASTLDYTATVNNIAANSTCFWADQASIVFEPPPTGAP